MAPVTGVIQDQGATTTDTGGMVFNVKAYGAVGNGTTDDTQAFITAIKAAGQQLTGNPGESAQSGMGGVVFVPQGIYIISETLTMPQGVGIRGAGMHTSQILFAMSANSAGLVWAASLSTPAFGVGGFLEDIDIKAVSYADGSTAGNLVQLLHWSDFAFNRVRIIGAAFYNLRITDSLNISAFHLVSESANGCNLWVGASTDTVTTSCRFVGCYFQGSVWGPCADVSGLALAFDGCVFEGAGEGSNASAPEAYGIRVRGGTVTLNAPYFEGNLNWDLIAGTDPVPPNSGDGASVTVINPVIVPDQYTKTAGAGGLYFQRGSAFVQGGNIGQSPVPLQFGSQMDLVQVAMTVYNKVPLVDGNGSLWDLPGWVMYKDPATGNVFQAGAAMYTAPPPPPQGSGSTQQGSS